MTPEVDSLTVHWTDPSGTTTPVGTLTTSRPLAQQTFTYVTGWLANQGFGIGEVLPPVPGPLRPPGGAASFGTITDSGPDAWGRRIIAAKTGTVVRNDTDAVIRAADATRQGALRYSRPPDGTFLAPEGEAESVTALPELLDEVEAFQHGEFTGSAVARILRAGTSQGGARPKAAVVDADGRLMMAKFPSTEDVYDVEGFEAACLHVARDGGLPVPAFRTVRLAGHHCILLVERFDRAGQISGRLGYQSMRTAMGLTGLESPTYQWMADTAGYLAGTSGRRFVVACAALNVCVNNVDDHPRNFGFLHQSAGWAVAPVFDVVPWL